MAPNGPANPPAPTPDSVRVRWEGNCDSRGRWGVGLLRVGGWRVIGWLLVVGWFVAGHWRDGWGYWVVDSLRYGGRADRWSAAPNHPIPTPIHNPSPHPNNPNKPTAPTNQVPINSKNTALLFPIHPLAKQRRGWQAYPLPGPLGAMDGAHEPPWMGSRRVPAGGRPASPHVNATSKETSFAL